MAKKKAPPSDVEVPVPTDKTAQIADLSAQIAGYIAPPGLGPLPTPAPGIYKGVPADVYHRWDAVSNSRLGLLDRSPAHLREAMLNPKPSTPAQVLGTITHCAVLEPETFDKTYITAGRCEAIKKDKDQCSHTGLEKTPEGWRCGVHGGAQATDVLSDKAMSLCLGVRESFRRKERAHAILSGPGLNELSIVWVDPITGLTCKARLDRISPEIVGGVIPDLKSTKDARKRPFSKAIYQYGYHRQGAMYLDGSAAVGLLVEHYAIAAFEKEPPYPIALYRLGDASIDAGRADYRRLMALYAECQERGEWPTAPSYPDTIEDIEIPDFAFEMIDTSFEDMGA